MLPIPGAIGLNSAVFSDPRANLLIRRIHCTGNESNLLECEQDNLFEPLCGPLDDAGVVCQGKENFFFNIASFCSFHFSTVTLVCTIVLFYNVPNPCSFYVCYVLL